MKLDKKYLFLTGLVLLISGAFLYKRSLISSFKVVGIQDACISESDLQKGINLKDKSIFFTDLNKLTIKLKTMYPCIKSVEYKYSLTSGLSIKVDKRVPLARVVSTNQAHDLNLKELEASASTASALLDWNFNEQTVFLKYFIVDSEGVVFEFKDENDLPFIYTEYENLKVGTVFDQSIFNAISHVWAGISSLGINFGQSKVINGYLLINSLPKLVFDLKGNTDYQLISLQLILNKARMNNDEIESIDLRFKNPVIKYSAKKSKNELRK